MLFSMTLLGSIVLFAQLPATPTDAAKIVEQATRSSWQEGLMALMFVVAIAGLSWLMRTVIATSSQREERMAKSIDRLENEQRTDLRDLVASNTKAITNLGNALESRPCFWDEAKRQAVKVDLANGTKS